MMAALSQLTASRPEGSIIELKFFKTGHSHMEADSMHAKIERDSKFREVAAMGAIVLLNIEPCGDEMVSDAI